MSKSIFDTLNAINVQEHIEKKNGMSYLPWAWAWAEIKKHYPGSFYTIYENRDNMCYHTDGKTCWVKTGVTVVDGDFCQEHIEYLPVMDMRNKSIPLNTVTSFDVNKAIQRSLTKACARHGLGLYVYAGEDLPEEERQQAQETQQDQEAQPAPRWSAKAEIEAFCMANNMTKSAFAAYRMAVISGGIVPDIPSAELDKEQCAALLKAIRDNLVAA